jgi:hypothetical protein
VSGTFFRAQRLKKVPDTFFTAETR